MSHPGINVVLLRFKQNMLFDKRYLQETSKQLCFILDKDKSISEEVSRFERFCVENNVKIDYFYNDSEYNQEIVQKFASALKLKGSLNEDQARCVRDKAIMKDRLQSIGYRTMTYKELTTLEDGLDFAKKQGGFPIIVKWRRGLSSKEVYKIENTDQLKALNLDYSTKRFIAETFCPFLIWCVDSLVQNGKVVATFLTWLPYTNLSFAEKKEKFAQITVDRQPSEVKFDGSKIVQNIVNELALKDGYLHLEAFVDTLGQPIICEFAWRTSGEHMLLNHGIAFGIDVYSLLIDIMVGKKLPPLKLVGQTCVGDMFLPLSSGKISKISSYDELKNLEGVFAGEIHYKTGDIIESKRQYTHCAGWLQVKGETKDEVLNRMLKVYEKFNFVTEGRIWK